MVNVKPVIAPLVPKRRLALSYLVRMMRKSVIYTAAVNIKILAKMLSCNTRALNMPAGIADTPR
jgi:hypothetical protein